MSDNERIRMSFDKDYPNRKDKRKPYRKAGRHTRSCRPGGSCAWCRGNRTIAAQRRKPADVTNQLKEAQ